MNSEGDPILIVGGPTASGKSSLALDLALRLRGVVINADSVQVYQELRILSARPTLADEKLVPHRLYGTLPARKPCSAGRWCSMALTQIADARRKQLLPIVVGGTGLYFRSLLKGLAPVPPVPEGIRDAAAVLHSEVGAVEFHRLLAIRDPDGAARIHPANTQRVLRAYEVFEATGKGLGIWQNEQAAEAGYVGKVATLVLEPSREVLYAACDARSEFMAVSGGVEEVAALLALELDPALPIMKALGVREFAAFLDGGETRAGAIENLRRATRRYAKRQATWFRHQMPEAKRVSARYNGAQEQNIMEIAVALLSETTSGQLLK